MCGNLLSYLGWRIYMEDAHISVSTMKNKNHSVFGVFDGHGGIFLLIKGLKYQLTSLNIS